jgi:iron(III) transport system permease protein
VWASFIRYWPYNLSLTLANYDFANFDSERLEPVFQLAEDGRRDGRASARVRVLRRLSHREGEGLSAGRAFAQFLAMLPMAVPGLVLGLGYVFFYNATWNPLGVLYGTLIVLVRQHLAHFYTVAHITATTALKQIDPEFEASPPR